VTIFVRIGCFVTFTAIMCGIHHIFDFARESYGTSGLAIVVPVVLGVLLLVNWLLPDSSHAEG
jgi:hypothetical protein